MHPTEWKEKPRAEIDVDEVMELAKSESDRAMLAIPRRIPLEDYRWGNATMEDGLPLEDFELEVKTIKEITLTVGGEKIVLKAETVQKVQARVKNIKNAFDGGLIQHAMRTIAQYTDLDQVAFQVLRMAIDPIRADQLANIYLSDKARRNVRCFSRPDVDSEECEWIVCPKDEGRSVIQKHLKNLLPMLIAEGCQMLEARLWKGKPVMTLIDKDQPRWIVFFCGIESDELEYTYAKPCDIQKCPDKMMVTAMISVIKTLVERNKERVIKLVKQYQMKEADVDMYLDMTRPVE